MVLAAAAVWSGPVLLPADLRVPRVKRRPPSKPGPLGIVTWQGQWLRPSDVSEINRRAASQDPDFPLSGGAAAGLVHYSTSHSRPEPRVPPERLAKARGATACVLVDPAKNRLSRMRTGTITAARLVDETCRRGGFRMKCWFVTLTYRPGETWRAKHISAFINALRMWQARAGRKLRYVWTAEMQERGAVHYHCIFWLPYGVSLPKPDKRGWWPWGMTQRVVAKNPVGYIAKYASKGEEGPAFPPGIRICGAGGFDAEARREARWWKAPKDARAHLGEKADIRRTNAGRFDALTGEFWRTPWRFVRINGVNTICKGLKHAA